MGAIFSLGAGIVMGIASKWMDLNTSFLGILFSELSIWVLICTMISIKSKTPIKAGINVLTFCLGMLASYYIMAELTDSIWGMNFAVGWIKFAFVTPVLASIVWFAAGSSITSKLIRLTVIIVMLAAQGFAYGLGFQDFIITAVMVILFRITARKKGDYKYDEYDDNDSCNDRSIGLYGGSHRGSKIK